MGKVGRFCLRISLQQLGHHDAFFRHLVAFSHARSTFLDMPKTKFLIDSVEGQAACRFTSRAVNRELVLDDEAREVF
jgi:hypothetical protein